MSEDQSLDRRLGKQLRKQQTLDEDPQHKLRRILEDYPRMQEEVFKLRKQNADYQIEIAALKKALKRAGYLSEKVGKPLRKKRKVKKKPKKKPKGISMRGSDRSLFKAMSEVDKVFTRRELKLDD